MVLEMKPSISVFDGAVRPPVVSGGSPVEGLSSFFADVSELFSRSCRRRISLSFSAIWSSRVRDMFMLFLLERLVCELRDVRFVLELFLELFLE